MLKRNFLIILVFCSFFLRIENVSADFSKITDKKTTFNLKANEEGLSVYATDLYFGSHELSSDDLNVPAENDMIINITEVSGLRPGWKLKGKFDSFEDNGRSFDGASLFYPSVMPITTTGGEAVNKPPRLLDKNTSFIGNFKGTIITSGGAAEYLAEAKPGNGFGEWYLPYVDQERVQLKVPTGERSGNYEARLTYTIESGPIAGQ